jgi:hypothetical protein
MGFIVDFKKRKFATVFCCEFSVCFSDDIAQSDVVAVLPNSP